MLKTDLKHFLKWVAGAAILLPLLSHRPPGSLTPAPTSLEDLEAQIRRYPKDFFRSPVDDAIRLTGTFGELRPDHFHSGIDIKSKTGGSGQPVFAAAAGYVSRVRVQAGGYGNVLYVTHPNGYVTVYAHLDRFSAEIHDYVLENQYNKESFEVDLKPREGQFRVRQGAEIGKLGNTGSSSGPHLHFEIREKTSEKALNPQLFGLPIPDKVAPEIRDMKVYFLNEKREVTGTKALPILKKKDGKYALKGGDTLKIGAWRVGFGIKTFDEMTGFNNDNGIYALALKVEDESAFFWRMEELDFDETRYHNAHIDYPSKAKFGSYFHRCFVLPGNRLSNYARTESGGAVALFKDKPLKINVKVMDAGGNTSEITFWARRDEQNMENPAAPLHQFVLPFDAESRIDVENFTMSVPKNCFYESVHFRYQTTPDDSYGVFSAVHHLGDASIPVHRFFEIGIRPTANLPEELRSKAVVAQCGAGRPENCGGSWSEGFLKTKIRAFGDYCIMTDTEPPGITPVVFDNDMRKKNTMAFRIRDNFAVDGSADGLKYRGEVDGRWILFEYDRKRDRLTHVFDQRIAPGKHTLRLSVSDDRGNEAVFEREFLR